MQEAAVTRIEADISGYRTPGGQADILGAVASVLANENARLAGFPSVNGRANAVTGYVHARLEELLHDQRRTWLTGRRPNKMRMDAIVDAAYGGTDDVAARGFWDAYRKVNDELVGLFNAAGGQLREMENFLPQKHDARKLAKAKELGVREVVSEFSTGGFSDASGVNIRRVAQQVNGAVVLPGETFSEPVTQATPFTYDGENREIGHHIGRLNITCAGSMRAPGEAIGVPVTEAAMDELAEAAGIDPVEFRLRNIPEADPSSGKPFSSNRLADCIRIGAERFGWSGRPKVPGSRREGEWLIGFGMSGVIRVNMLGDSTARVTLRPDGTALVETDMTDIGTGSYSVLTQIAAEMLGLPPDRVTTVLGDSDLPPSIGSGGSRGAASSGSSVMLSIGSYSTR